MTALKVTGSKGLLYVFTILILIGVFGIITEQVEFLSSFHELDFIVTEVKMEANIAILLAAFGAFLEYRHWIFEQLNPSDVSEADLKFNEFAQKTGAFLILNAIFIECFDLAFLAMETWNLTFPLLKYIEITILFSLNIVAVFILLNIFIKLFLSSLKKT